MNEEIKFKTLEELYERIRPALYSKVLELKKFRKNYIKEEDIWNYLSENVWSVRANLTLNEMTSDIFDLDNDVIDTYVLNNLKNTQREVKYNNGDLL